MTESLAEIEARLKEDFAFLDNWEDRYRHIIDLGESLPVFDESLRTDETRVHGCVSQVWLATRHEDGRLFLSGTSDSAIVRGLMALLFALYQGRAADEVAAHAPQEFFDSIGLSTHLSPSRSSGFYAMMQKIKSLAQA